MRLESKTIIEGAARTAQVSNPRSSVLVSRQGRSVPRRVGVLTIARMETQNFERGERRMLYSARNKNPRETLAL